MKKMNRSEMKTKSFLSIYMLVLVTILFQFVMCQNLLAKEKSGELILTRMKGQTFRVDSGKIRSIAISPDGNLTAISESSEVKVWNGTEYIARFDARQVNNLLFSPVLGTFKLLGKYQVQVK